LLGVIQKADHAKQGRLFKVNFKVNFPNQIDAVLHALDLQQGTLSDRGSPALGEP
jgi:hypothetical protein